MGLDPGRETVRNLFTIMLLLGLMEELQYIDLIRATSSILRMRGDGTTDKGNQYTYDP